VRAIITQLAFLCKGLDIENTWRLWRRWFFVPLSPLWQLFSLLLFTLAFAYWDWLAYYANTSYVAKVMLDSV